MLHTIWSLITLVFLPVGGVLATGILSGYETLEKLSRKTCKIEIQLGAVSIALPLLISAICAICLGGESMALGRLRAQKESAQLEPLEFNEAWRAALWRHQRNWWLSLSSLLLWMIVWRLTTILEGFRLQVKSIEKQKIEALRERANKEAEAAAEDAAAHSSETAATPTTAIRKTVQEKKKD